MKVALRVPLLAGGAIALVSGLYGALLLLGVALPSPRPALADVHGPVMVLGFVGTLVALERAVALRQRWGMLAPACAAAGAIVLVLAGPHPAGKVLLATAGVLLFGIYLALWRRQPGAALLGQAAGAIAWYAAALLWLAGFSIAVTAPWLACFVVATIAGERLELTRLAPRPTAEHWFLAALAALVGGATAATLWPGVGHHLFGFGLLAMVAWLAGFDVARRTVRSTGLPRYVGIGLLAGYAWLVLAGVLWAGAGATYAGPRYDATLHAVFLGFTMSMIFVHAPVILPAVLRRPLPYHPALYVPLVLLHLSLVVRVAGGDGLSLAGLWRWSGIVNVACVVGFALLAAWLTTRSPARTKVVAEPAAVPSLGAGARS